MTNYFDKDWITGETKKNYKDGIRTLIHPELKKITDLVSAECNIRKFEAGGILGNYLKDKWPEVLEDVKKIRKK